MKKKGIFKVLNIIKNVICWALIVVLVSFVVIFLTARIKGETPSVLGFSIMRVSSGSMEPELLVGDVILDRKVDDASKLKVGDVITFRGENELNGLLVTHKIIKAPYEENGKLMLQTKGVANDVADSPILASSVEGIMVQKITWLKRVYEVFLSPWGLLILIALILLIFVDEIIAIARVVTGNEKSAKDGENINDIIERLQSEKAVEQKSENESDSEEENG